MTYHRTNTPSLDGWLSGLKDVRTNLLRASKTLGDFRDRSACAAQLKNAAQRLLEMADEMAATPNLDD